MRRGFTLIEVLLTLTLLALLISLVQGAYSGAARSRRRAGAETEQAHLAAFVLQKISAELATAYFSAPRQDVTGLVLDADAEGNAALRFTTRLPPISGHSLGGESQVSYTLEEDEDGWTLARRESPNVEADIEAADAYTMIKGIRRFSVLCYDGEEWLESWDSRDRTDPPILPLAVTLEVAWAGEDDREEEGTERLYRTSTPVYGAR